MGRAGENNYQNENGRNRETVREKSCGLRMSRGSVKSFPTLVISRSFAGGPIQAPTGRKNKPTNQPVMATPLWLLSGGGAFRKARYASAQVSIENTPPRGLVSR